MIVGKIGEDTSHLFYMIFAISCKSIIVSNKSFKNPGENLFYNLPARLIKNIYKRSSLADLKNKQKALGIPTDSTCSTSPIQVLTRPDPA